MSITDLFKPRWKNPDEHVRAEAVTKLDNAGIIEELALHDPSPLVRAAATAKLTNNELIKKIAEMPEQDFTVRKAAMNLLEDDQETLAQIAVYLLSHDEFKTLSHLYSNQDTLARIAIYGQKEDVALEAAMRIINQKLLEQIALHSSLLNVRVDAVSRLHDHKMLAELAGNDPEQLIRHKAVEKITDMELLARIAKNDPVPEVRAGAVSRLRDQPYLQEALLDPEEIVRMAALKKLHDPQVIANVAINDASANIRREATNKIIGDDFLLQVVQQAADPEIRSIAVSRMSNNEEMIINHVFNDPDPAVRRVGLAHLHTPELIADIAVSDTDTPIRFSALNRIEDDEVLKSIQTRCSDVRMKTVIDIKLGDCAPFFEMFPQLDDAGRSRLLRLLDYPCMDALLHSRNQNHLESIMEIYKEEFCSRYIHITENEHTCSCMVCETHVNDFVVDSKCPRCGMDVLVKDIQPGSCFFGVNEVGSDMVGICMEHLDPETITADSNDEKIVIPLKNIQRIISFNEYIELKDKLWQANLVS